MPLEDVGLSHCMLNTHIFGAANSSNARAFTNQQGILGSLELLPQILGTPLALN